MVLDDVVLDDIKVGFDDFSKGEFVQLLKVGSFLGESGLKDQSLDMMFDCVGLVFRELFGQRCMREHCSQRIDVKENMIALLRLIDEIFDLLELVLRNVDHDWPPSMEIKPTLRVTRLS
jgi:hypothetical protein